MENVLDNISKVFSLEKIMTTNKAKELYPLLPFKSGGVTFRLDDSNRGEVRHGRQGSVMSYSNTPAVQLVTRAYDPRDLRSLAEETIIRDYDEGLRAWEGDWDDILEPRGASNWWYLLEMAATMGPQGSPIKKGPTPYDWELFDQATDIVISKLLSAIGGVIQPKHIAPSTPLSTAVSLRLAHVAQNSAGEPFFSDKSVPKTSKAINLEAAVGLAAKFSQPGERALPMYPFLMFARYDRAGAWPYYLDSDKARSYGHLALKWRMIAAQNFSLQLMDGAVTQALQEAISAAAIPEIDCRDPARLSDHFVDGQRVIKDLGDRGFSIGADQSAWDLFVNPQLWYGTFRVYKAMFPAEADMLFVEAPKFLKVEAQELERFGDLEIGKSVSADFTHIAENGAPRTVSARVSKLGVDMDTYLRRVFASASGTGGALGQIIVEGYKTVIETPKDGKFQCGFGQRSGNFMTFLSNCIMNLIEQEYVSLASREERTLIAFEREFGYRPPPMFIRWIVVRGDDSAAVWEVPDIKTPEDWKITELYADWMTHVGKSANAKKQEASDIRGKWEIGFAQIYVSDVFPRGVKSVVRALTRMVYNEQDEVVPYDPDTGEDLRHTLVPLANFGRLQGLWGAFQTNVHPRHKEFTAMMQDLDRESRLLPPMDEEGLRQMALASALKMVRRGQLRPEDVNGYISQFWATDMSTFLADRYESEPKLHDRTWTPLKVYTDPQGNEDSRFHWRNPANNVDYDYQAL
jgi:hypothetical protein